MLDKITAPDGDADLTGWPAAVEVFTAEDETELRRLDEFKDSSVLQNELSNHAEHDRQRARYRSDRAQTRTGALRGDAPFNGDVALAQFDVVCPIICAKMVCVCRQSALPISLAAARCSAASCAL